jgi:hypothetical protein
MMFVRSALAMGMLMIALLAGCKSDSDNNTNPDPTPTGYYMTATADGSAFSAVASSCIAVQSSGILSIAGSTLTNPPRQITLMVQGPVAGQTYTIGTLGSATTGILVVGTTAADAYSANMIMGTGSIKIDKLDATNVEGTFSFTGMNNAGASKSVADGKFRCKIQ